MLRFKQFWGAGRQLEDEVNIWLAEYEPDVTTLVQTTIEGGAVVISILFEESFRAQEIRLAAESSTQAVDSVMRPDQQPDRPLEVISESIPPAGGVART